MSAGSVFDFESDVVTSIDEMIDIARKVTGRTNPRDLYLIADCMRCDIFAYRVSGLSEQELRKAVGEAVDLLLASREIEPATADQRALLPALRAIAATAWKGFLDLG